MVPWRALNIHGIFPFQKGINIVGKNIVENGIFFKKKRSFKKKNSSFMNCSLKSSLENQ